VTHQALGLSPSVWLGRPSSDPLGHRREGPWQVSHGEMHAPGGLENRVRHEKKDGLDSEEECIHDRELLHNALEVSIVSSSTQKIRPHVHGVGSGIGGRFWVSGSGSNSKVDEVIMVDELVSSMSNLSISSPMRPPTPKSVVPLLVSVEGQSMISFVKDTTTSSIHDRGSKIRMGVDHQARNSHRSWEEPLPALRISPKMLLGDALQKAKVQYSTLPTVSSYRGATMINHPKR
jgi:hypothetical protein